MSFDAEQALAKARAAGKNKKIRQRETLESTRQQNRELMPNVGKIVDHVTATFGKVKVTGAIEYCTGYKVGRL